MKSYSNSDDFNKRRQGEPSGKFYGAIWIFTIGFLIGLFLGWGL